MVREPTFVHEQDPLRTMAHFGLVAAVEAGIPEALVSDSRAAPRSAAVAPQ